MALNNRLVVVRSEFNHSLKSLRNRKRLYEAAGLAFEGGILSIQLDDVMVAMRAHGEWQGTAEFSPQVIIALLKVPPTEDPVVLTYEDGRISIGPLSVPCRWTTLSEEFIGGVENPGVLDLLAIGRSMPKAEIHRTGLWRRINRAKGTVTLALEKSARNLRDLEISEAELREMVEARIRARLRERSPDSVGGPMKIDLASGRAISLSRITQCRTNAGVLCGKPTEESNDERLRRVVEEAREFGGFGEPVLIEPPRALVPADTARDLPAGEWLPDITCIAVFDSIALLRDDSDPYSSLVIAWLQDGFAPPIDDAVLTSIRQIDWEQRATGWCW